MTFETGVFHECYKYSKNFNLPIKFIVEDNNLKNTPTNYAWNKNKMFKDINITNIKKIPSPWYRKLDTILNEKRTSI